MIEALRFQQATPPLVAPPISDGLPKGLVLQLWIRRTGDITGQPIVELTGTTSRIMLRTGTRADVLSLAVLADGKTTEISAPGALPIARWVQVRATIAANGTAKLDVLGMRLAEGTLPAPGSEARTLKVGAFIGELTQLQVWKHASPTQLSYSRPKDLSAPNLWAYYPLAALESDAASSQTVAKDAGPNGRHAVLQLSSVTPSRVVHDEPLNRDQTAHLRFVDNGSAKLGPLIGLSGKVTLEAWVFPDGDSPMPVFLLHGADSRLVLVVGGQDGEMTLLSDNRSSTVLARATGLVQPNQWSHVAVTLEATQLKLANSVSGGQSKLKIGLFQHGQLRKSESLDVNLQSKALPAATLVWQALIPEVQLGGLTRDYTTFRGGMAEVRIWRGTSRERVESLWLARARGDEDELSACYRLDTEPPKPLVDISPSRGVGRAPSGIELRRNECPPLAATSGELAFRVSARGKLLRDRVPKPSTGASTKINTQITNLNTSETVDAGSISEVRNVFHVSVDVATRSGNSPLGRTLEVRLDQPLTLLQTSGQELVQTAWAANQSHTIPLPASGRVRLRFAAEALACPTIRVRVIGTPGGVWTIVRPDETAQMRLRATTAASLKSPADGRPSPLPAGTSDDDTRALVDALARLGTQMVREPSTSSTSSTASTKLLGPIDGWVEQGVDAVVDTGSDGVHYFAGTGSAILSGGEAALESAITLPKTAGQLITLGTDEIEALVAKCEKVTAWLGEEAIASAITSANQLAVRAAKYGGQWIEIVGTTLVQGGEVAWRVIVAGVDDALAAVTKLIERIGAKIQEWIDYLSWLFAWNDFLEASDEAYAVIQEAMGGVEQQIAGLDALKTQLGDALRESVEDAIGKRSLADVFGIDVDADSEAFEQLDYVQEQFQLLIESTELKWVTAALDQESPIAPSEAVSAQASELEKLQPFGDPSDIVVLLDTPMSELLAGNQQLANGSSSIYDAVFDPIVDSTTELLEQLDSAMFGQLSVPYVTDFIESVILCGRTLTVARVMALMAAIPVVLIEKSSKQSRTLITVKSTDELSDEEKERQDHDRRTRWALWCVMAAGLINTGVVIGKSVAERRSQSTANSKLISFLQLTSGSIGIFRGIILLGRVPAFPPSTQFYASINASVEMIAGLCAAWFGTQGLKELRPTETRADWSKVEMVIQLLLGATVITSSGIALCTGDLGDDRTKTAFSLRCSSWVLSLLVRGFEKIDDGDTSGRLKYVTMGLAVLASVVEVSEAIYGNYAETDAQT